MKVRVTRDVLSSENYSGRDVKEGEVLYVYQGHTYGCIDWLSGGVALTERDGETPFFEFPGDAVEVVDD